MKIAILTNFMEFLPGYSLTGIVKDQVSMLTRHGHEVHLFVNEQFNDRDFDSPAVLHRQIPFAHLVDYQSQADLSADHRMTVKATAAVLKKELAEMDLVFTHDFVFTGWFLPYCLGCVEASRALEGLRWMHWIHSVPSVMRDWWNVRAFGPAHVLVYPNNADLLLVAEQYRGALEHCRCIHHIKDPRAWFEFSPETCDLIDRMPALMQADIVQLLPASVDRLFAKRVKEVMVIFGWFKKWGHSVCLAIANQWATTRTHKETIETYLDFAREQGLVPGDEVLFTSSVKPEYEVGISKRMIRELFQLSNVFIFPTREESFGLVMPEAALSGAYIVVNQSLDVAREVTGGLTYGAEFGSHRRSFRADDPDNYLRMVAQIILGRLRQNEAILTRTHARQRYNWDYLYDHEYAPVMAELTTWADKGQSPGERREAAKSMKNS